MSSEDITIIELDSREAYLTSELDGGPPYTVSGVALGANDITRGASGVKKLWPAEELKKAAKSLQGTNLVEDHENSSRGVIGTVTKAGYKEGVGVLYEAELFDRDLAEKISSGLLEVSVRGFHRDVDEMEVHEDTGAKIVEDIEFDNLSIVPDGASPSNTLEMGPAESLSAAELSSYVSALQEEEEDGEIEPGMWVTTGDTNGITISQVEDGEVEVDIYEKQDDKWRAIGETETFSVDSLEKWDVDEEEDIGAQKKEDDEDDEESGDEEEAEADEPAIPMPEEVQLLYPEQELAEEVGEELGIPGFHTHSLDGDTWYMPGEDHEVFVERMTEIAEDDAEMAQHFEEVETVLAKHKDDGEDEEEMSAEGEEDTYSNDTGRAEGADESRNPDGAFDDEYVEELQEYSFHTPDWSGTTESDWSTPDFEDFRDPYNISDEDSFVDLSEDMKGAIAEHFLIAQSSFPGEAYDDLKLPVVEPNGELNVNALSAVKGGRGASAVDGLSDDMEERIINWVNETANDEFDRDWGMDEEENASGDDLGITTSDSPTDESMPTHDPMDDDEEAEMMDPVDASLDLINVFLRQNGKDERDSVDKMLGWLFSSTDVPTEKLEAFRVAANTFLQQQGGTDSFDAIDIDAFRSWLLTQGGQTDDGTHARPTQPGAGSGVPRIATPVHVLSGDDLRSATVLTGASKKGGDSESQDTTTMTDIEEELEDLDEPVAVEREDFESLQEKADRFDEMSENLEALRERTDVLDSVDREQVEELADSEDPVVLEQDEYEALSDEAEQVKQVYAEALANETFSADDLVDKFSIEELREKYEEAGHDLEDELEAAPKGADPSEEELEEKAEEENKSQAELEKEEQIEQKQEELRAQILGDD